MRLNTSLKGHLRNTNLPGLHALFSLYEAVVNSIDERIKFASTSISVTFPELDDKELCVMEIAPCLEPIYTSVIDKNGGKSEKFYLRSGNSSQELKLSEVSGYISGRFDG